MEDRLRSELKAKDKQIGQLKKYARQLEGQIGLEEPVPQEQPEDTKPAEKCPYCKSFNVTFLKTFKVNKPVRIMWCRDCDQREVVPCP